MVKMESSGRVRAVGTNGKKLGNWEHGHDRHVRANPFLFLFPYCHEVNKPPLLFTSSMIHWCHGQPRSMVFSFSVDSSQVYSHSNGNLTIIFKYSYLYA